MPPLPVAPAADQDGERRVPAPEFLAAVFAVVLGLALYLPTAARGIGFIDRGELAAVAATLGIAHPTGYPTLTMLGHVVTLVTPLRPVLALNLFAAVLAALGLGVLVLLFDHLLARLVRRDGRAGRTEPATLARGARAAIALLAALATGVTATWWQQANGFEAYALHALLLPLVLWTFVRWVDAIATAPDAGLHAGRGAAFAFALGLSLTNHLTTVMLAPACVAAFLLASGWRQLTLQRLLVLVPPFLLGITPYLYLPLRSMQQPRFDWGNPEVAWRFVSHVTAQQYRGWMFSSLEVAQQQLGFFFQRMPGEFAWGGLLVIAWGALHVVRADRTRAVWLGLIAGGSLAYFAGYAIRDIDPYAMPAFVVLGACFAAGLAALAVRHGARIALVLGVFLVVASAALHYRACDESANVLVEDLATRALEVLPPDAVLVSSQWDYTVSATLYLQTIERLRPDVLVVNPELMRRSWYLEELARRAPEFAARFAPEAREFARVVNAFERGGRYEGETIQAAYDRMLEVMVSRWLGERRMFASSEVQPARWAHYHRVPAGLAFELRADTAYVPLELPRWQWRPWRGRVDAYVATVSWVYGQALVARMEYEAAHGFPGRARRFGDLALSFDPAIRRDRIPPLPFDGRELVDQSARFFDDLRAHLARLPAAGSVEAPPEAIPAPAGGPQTPERRATGP